MYDKMLVPLDASEYAECTLEHVKEVATAHGVKEIVLLYVVEPLRQPAVAHLGGDRVAEVAAVSRDSAQRYLEQTRDKLGLGSAVKTAIVTGRPADAILDYINESGVDLVIMSSHGHSGPSRWFIGSVAERVVQRSSVPVFLVPSLACRLGA